MYRMMSVCNLKHSEKNHYHYMKINSRAFIVYGFFELIFKIDKLKKINFANKK